MNQPEQFRSLVESSDRIFVTPHIIPDPDAYASAVVMAETIRAEFPGKSVQAALELNPAIDGEYAAWPYYQSIARGDVPALVADYRPDLLIITDTPTFDRVTAKHAGALALRQYLTEGKGHVRSIILDHHEPTPSQPAETVDLYIKSTRPSAAEAAYALLFDQLKWRKPADYAQLVMLGIVADTLDLRVSGPDYRPTRKIMEQLIIDGADRQKAHETVTTLDEEQQRAYDDMMKNKIERDGYVVSFLSEQAYEHWHSLGRTDEELKKAVSVFANYNLYDDTNNFGAVVVPCKEPGTYRTSLRSRESRYDMRALANLIGTGGGHVTASGATVHAETLQAAVTAVEWGLMQLSRRAA